MRTVFALIIATLATTPSWAQSSGKDLLNLCTSQDGHAQLSCLIYITGFIKGMRAQKNLNETICLPDDLTGEKAADVFTKFLQAIEKSASESQTPAPDVNPLFTDDQDTSLAATLYMTYPCSDNK
jgi:hypothetical protein